MRVISSFAPGQTNPVNIPVGSRGGIARIGHRPVRIASGQLVITPKALSAGALTGGKGLRLTWKLDAETMGLAALTAGDSAAFLSGMNPSIFTIRKFQGDWSSDTETKNDIHTGMLIANALAVLVGFGATVVASSWWPVVMTIGVTIILDLAYEWALQVSP